MYLPPGLTLLRLLQLPLSFSNSDQQTPHIVVPNEQLRGHHHGSKDLNSLANLSPYHDASAFHGVSSDLPKDCTVDQVILLHRHGSRGPAGEQDYIHKLVSTLDAAWDVIQTVDLPRELEFLKEGYKYQLVPEQLTVVGREQLFSHGVDFALDYPTFSTDLIMSTTSQRVIDSAHFFAQGLFGRDADKIRFSTPEDCEECNDPVSWLDTWRYCPKLPYVEAFEAGEQWAKKYIPPIVERLNARIPDIGFSLFSFDDVRGALYACAYDLAARKESPWCNVFRAHELQDFEYELDLMFDGITGYEGDPGPLVGAIYMKKIIDRLTDELEVARPHAKRLYLEFAHDFTILLALSTMGLNKDDVPLGPGYLRPDRKFRTSDQTPFAANMVWEKFTCDTSFKGPQLRLLLNRETFPLSFCQDSKKDRKYGTCSLDAFVRKNEFSMSVEYQDELWNERCGVPKQH